MKTDYGVFFLICVIILTVLAFFCLVRAILGPRLTDRIVAVNVMGTITIIDIALLSVYLDESNILDICLLFAAMSFIAVIVLTKIYLGIFNEIKAKEPEEKKELRSADLKTEEYTGRKNEPRPADLKTEEYK